MDIEDERSNTEFNGTQPNENYDMPTKSILHVHAAMPILRLIIYLAVFLSFLAIVGGILGLNWNTSSIEFSVFGVRLTTGYVGVAFVAPGVVLLIAVVTAVLSNVYKLAALPEDQQYTKPQKEDPQLLSISILAVVLMLVAT